MRTHACICTLSFIFDRNRITLYRLFCTLLYSFTTWHRHLPTIADLSVLHSAPWGNQQGTPKQNCLRVFIEMQSPRPCPIGLPWWPSGVSVPGVGRSPGEGNGNPPQYTGLGNPMDRGTWWAGPWSLKESDST